MKIFKKNDCIVSVDENNNYLVNYHDDFYRMKEEEFDEYFGLDGLKYKKEIKDAPIICFIMVLIILTTIIIFFLNEKYVIIDRNFLWANLIVIINIFIHELGHVFFLKLFFHESKVKMGFKIIFIYPAFYVDTSNTYFLPKYKRIIVYLAGNFTNCLYLLICNIFFKRLNEYNYLIMSTILIIFLPIIKSDGYYAFMTLINKYNYQKTKVKNIIEDTIRGIIMFVVLYLLSYMNVRL